MVMAEQNQLIKNGIIVAAGGAIGASLRHATNLITMSAAGDFSLFIATAIENMAGCFLIGLFYALLTAKTDLNRKIKLFLLTGIIGSYTTYSGFIADALLLIRDIPSLFFLYFFGQILTGILLVIVGIWTGNKLVEFNHRS